MKNNKETAVKIDRVPGIKKDRRYIGIMNLLFNQSERIKKQLPKIRLDKETLSRITKEYHSEVCHTGEECIEFEYKSDTHFFQFDFMLSAGIRAHSFSSKAVSDYWSTLNVVSDDVKSVTPAITAQFRCTYSTFDRLCQFAIRSRTESVKKGIMNSKQNILIISLISVHSLRIYVLGFLLHVFIRQLEAVFVILFCGM